MKNIVWAAFFLLMVPPLWAVEPVIVREEPMVIPTWEIGPSAIHPTFDQFKQSIYPYTLNEALTDKKVDKTYQAVTMENEYIRILILPEIGGRLHGALDKTNNYVWLYWQKTVKPGLISMTGAWISGGIEWNFPHGHRPSGFMTVDHRIVTHPDGSATVWVGETEPIYRMRWLVGITLQPGRSYIHCQYIFINPTNYKHPFQFWATSATHANEWAQAQYPGDMVTGHGKHEFWNWPIDHGIDLSWWKNSANASSYFAFNNSFDWFGTYDHKAQAGMVHVASHYSMPGKKLWTWGSGPSGRIWEDILTEGGGAYFEPQAGAWSDNQPDHHWMQPQEVKTTQDYWYPVRDTRGYHNADKDFAINTDLQNGLAFGAVSASGVFKDYRIVLRNARTNTVLREAITTLSPDKPFTAEVRADVATTVYDLHLAVYDATGNLCLDLQQHPPEKVTLPPGQKDPGDPKQMGQDQLYHSAEWLDRFARKGEARSYYQETLKRDPKDSRVNTELGFNMLKQGRWNEALEYLNTALERDNDNSRIYFGKGLAYAGREQFKEAYDQFSRATYTYDYFAPAYLNLALLDLRQGSYAGALAKAMEAESQNGKFADIPAFKAAAFRHLGDLGRAEEAAEHALQLDPMHLMAGQEHLLALKGLGKSTQEWEGTWNSIMRGAVQNYLELATAYARAGLFRDAESVLAGYASGKNVTELYPMVSYLRGYFKELQGDLSAAAEFYAQGTLGPAIYTNPHRIEEKAALEAALRRNPNDAKARLYLGNIMYALGQSEEGLGQWQKAVQSDPQLSLAWRNIGFAEASLNKNPKAAYAAYQKVMQLDSHDGMALLELSRVAEALKIPAARQLAYLNQFPQALASRDNLIARLLDLHLDNGSEDSLRKVEEILNSRHFHTWEGSYAIHEAWVEVYQKLGDKAFAKKDYAAALAYYGRCLEYPKNLEMAPRSPDFSAHILWNLAKVHLAMNQRDTARADLGKILAEKYGRPHLGTYYQALAEKELKNPAAYQALLSSVEKRAREYISGKSELRRRPPAIGHYLLSLVLEEKGETTKARAELGEALSQDSLVRRQAVREAQLDTARAHQ